MENSKNKKIICTITWTVAILLLTAYAVSLVILHFNQTQYPITHTYESDLFAHIEMAMDGWGYSITALIFRLCSLLPGKLFYFAIAALLTICEITTITLTFLFSYKQTKNKNVSLSIAAISSFVMPMFIVWVQPYRYAGYQSPSIWHNSTYIVMKFLGLLGLMVYLGLCVKLKDELSIGKLIAFSLLLALTTSVKTNFILIFAPAAFIFLIIDIYFKVPIKRIILCALTLIPSIGVILFQKYVLFGADTGNGITIDPLYSVYLRTGQPYFTMILSAAFPVFVFLFNIFSVLKDTVKDFKTRDVLRHRVFLLSWTLWSVAFAELILLRETGARELDDNFAWGYDFALFLVFVISLIYFVKNMTSLKRLITENKNEKKNVSVIVLNILYVLAALIILFYHLYCGIYFFIRLLGGATFFMY